MSYFFLINTIFVLLINILSFWIGFWVFLSNKKERVNQIFFLMTFLVILWIDSAYLTNFLTQGYFSYLLAKIGYGAGSLFLGSLYLFFNYFPQKEKVISVLNKSIIIICLCLFLFSVFTNLLVKSIETTRWGNLPVLGIGKSIFLGSILILGLFIIVLYLIKYFRIPEQEKLKVQYLLIGLFIYIIMNLIFNIVLPFWQGIPQYYHFGNYSAIFLLGFTAYAIVKHQLFGIKVVLTALLVAVIAIILAIQIFTAPSFGWKMLNSGVLVVFCYFGYYLVKAVQGEEKRREEAEMMVVREGALRKRAEKLADEFKKLDEAKSQFMLATQHHLRTPLTAIQGYLSMLYEGSWGKINPAAKSKIKSAFDSTQKLIKLVNEFLDIAQFEVGKETIVKQEIQIEEAVREVVEELKPEAEKKELYLKFEKPELLPKVMADTEKMKEALYNVVYNAIKYTRKGGAEVKLQIENGKLQIIVSDTGIGMERDEILGLFQKSFARGEEAKKLYTTGRGIGLYLTYQIVKAHGGRIWAESKGKDKGSTFYIELPIK